MKTNAEQKAGGYSTKYRFTGKEVDEETGLYYFGARYAACPVCTAFGNPRISLWYGVDPLAEKHPDYSSYLYTANNPITYLDPDGRDFVILIAKGGAGGYGHMAAVIQDGKGGYHYVTMGNAENGAGVSKMATSGTQGGMRVTQLKGVKSMKEAIAMAKQDQNNSPYTDQVEFNTSSKTDKKIFDNVNNQAEKINNGDEHYNVCSMNCTDAVERPIEKAIGIKLPEDMVPNKNFDKIKDLKRNIQDRLDIKEGRSTVKFIKSGLDNYPEGQRPIIVPIEDK